MEVIKFLLSVFLCVSPSLLEFFYEVRLFLNVRCELLDCFYVAMECFVGVEDHNEGD